MRVVKKSGLGVFVFALLCCSTKVFSSTNPEALERYALVDLVLIRTVMYSDAYRQAVALVRDPDGYIHVAVRGSYIGKNKGVLTKIKKTEIVVSEIDEGGREKFVVLSVNKNRK